ncbi:hypothetical protein M3J09_009822 [Ascochyta lentis]
MPSATLKRLNTMMRCLVAIHTQKKGSTLPLCGALLCACRLEWSPKLLQSVGEREVVHRHAKVQLQGVLSETRPRHAGRPPVLSIARLQPESRALRDFAKR